MTHDTPQVLYVSADTSGQTTRYIASPEMHTGAEAWVPKAHLDALVEAGCDLLKAVDDFTPGSKGGLRLRNAADAFRAALPAPPEGAQGEGG